MLCIDHSAFEDINHPCQELYLIGGIGLAGGYILLHPGYQAFKSVFQQTLPIRDGVRNTGGLIGKVKSDPFHQLLALRCFACNFLKWRINRNAVINRVQVGIAVSVIIAITRFFLYRLIL